MSTLPSENFGLPKPDLKSRIAGIRPGPVAPPVSDEVLSRADSVAETVGFTSREAAPQPPIVRYEPGTPAPSYEAVSAPAPVSALASRNPKQRVQITIRLRPDVAESLKQYAERERYSYGDIFEMLLRKHGILG